MIDSGVIYVDVAHLGKENEIKIEVKDNGIGLDKERFDAFCQIDTDFKKEKGGKGVGRLFWLDAFDEISVTSNFLDGSVIMSRSFCFILGNEDQITDEKINKTTAKKTGTSVIFDGLRPSDYVKHFPRTANTFVRYLSSHFISDFLLNEGPQIIVNIEGSISNFPTMWRGW